MSWNQRLWYGIGGERGLSASIITIRGEKKKKKTTSWSQKKGAELRFCVESSDSSGWGSDWDKCSRNGVLLPHRWSIVCQHQSARKWENSPFICSWFIEDATAAAFECLEPTALSRGPIGLSQFIFLFIRWECTFWFICPYDSPRCEEKKKKKKTRPTSARPPALPRNLRDGGGREYSASLRRWVNINRRSPRKQMEAASPRRFSPRILHKHRATDDFTQRWNAPARRRKGK